MKELKHFCLFLAMLICSLQYSVGIDAPDDVAVSNNGSTTSLKVKWTPPANATGQEVRWSPADGNGTSYIISGTRNEFTITALTPGTPYNVTVTVYNGTDDSSTSAPIEDRTRPSPVSDLEELGATNESISASWTKPYGMVDQYLVSCSSGTVAPPSPIIDDDGNTAYEASCVGLSTAGANYTITVTAQSGSEVSDPSTIPITALPNMVLIVAGNSTNSSFSASWMHPAGEIDFFQVFCYENDMEPEEIYNVSSNSIYEVTCENLPTAGTGYQFSMVSVSGNKNVTSKTVLYTNPNYVNLRAGEITTTQITVEWDDPEGVEDSFIVDCASNGTTDITLYPGNATNGTFEATCDVPMAGASFNITVISVSGEKQSSVTETFMAAVPEQVDVDEMSSNTTSITVSWTEVPSADGFEVSCSNGTSVPSSPLPDSATQVTCDGVLPGGNHSVSIVTVENGGKSPATVTYVVAVPLRANLSAGNSLTTSVSAMWPYPGGLVDVFDVVCSNGTESNATVVVGPTDLDTSYMYLVSCDGVWRPGDNYTMMVISVSNNQKNSASIVLTALPRSVDLVANDSTTTSVSATWQFPGGIVEDFEVECSRGNMTTATDMEYLASCEELDTPGDNYTMTVTSISNEQENSASIVLTALPLSVNLTASNSTTMSVSATWQFPGGVVEVFEVDCSNGTASNSTVLVDEDVDLNSSYLVRCDGVWNPGDNYFMVVTSVSNQQENSASIVLTALPLSVDLVPSNSTTTSVSATWQFPGGVVEVFEVDCSNGTASDSRVLVDEDVYLNSSYLVRCDDVWNPGDNYTMFVTSVSNQQENSASIVLTALPLSVVLVANDSTTTSVSATWQYPGGIVEEFEVECSSGNKTTYTATAMEYLVSCENLNIPGDDYTMTVTSLSNGQRDSSSIVLTALPERVTLTEESDMVNTTTITASWSNADGVFDYYEVSCSNGTASPDRVNPTDDLIASCTGLTIPGDVYNISVTTISSGQRSETDTITITALPDAVTLAEGPSNNTAISATWTVLGVVDSFTITCSNGTASPSSILVSSSPTNETFRAYCTGLPTPGLEYFLSVGAFSNNKPGAIRTVGVHASPSGVTLEEGPSTTTSVSATWMDPDGAVDHYNITCSDGVASPEIITDTTQSSYLASCVNVTTPGDTYTMTVYSFVDNGTTSSSSSINLIALPAMVTDLSESGATTDSVSANWTKPAGVVTSYNITCPVGPTQTLPEGNDHSTHMVTCDGLQTAGANYTITVIAVSGDQTSAPATVSITAYPNIVDLMEVESTTRQITVEWDNPEGDEDSFIVDCAADGNNDITLDADDATNGMFQATCNVTMAGAPYNITVTSVSVNKQSSVTETFTAATPSAVTIEGTSSNTTSITVSWNASSSADNYEVDCLEGGPSPFLLPGSATQVTCAGVTPGGNHSVSIVTVENDGRSSATVTYVVAVPLSADLDASASTTTSVSAMWPYPGGLVDVFDVVCSNGTESNATVVVDPTDLDTSYLVSCDDVYNPGDNYTMSVTSISNKKENSASIVLTALPLSVKLVSSDSTTASVSATWDFPGGIVDEFEVECSNGTETFSSADSDEGYRASCEGLDNPGDNYTMTVTSLSNMQRNSALIVLTALPAAVTLTEVTADVTTSSITASWSNATGVFDYYDVSCSNGTASPAQVSPSEDLIASCVNLSTPGDDYDISVTTVSNGLYSEISTITITALPEAVELVESGSNTDFISASWRVPGSVVETFNITCSAGTASPSSIPVNSSQAGQELMASCIDLPRSGEEYTLSVVAISREKQSAVSEIRIYALPLGVDLEEGPSTLTSVSATWMRQNDTVESYRITCNKGDASPPTIEDTSQQSYSASCVNLTGPGATYTMFVYSEVGTNTSSNFTSSSSIRLVAVPESVERVSVVDYNTTTVNVGWKLKDCLTCVYNRFILTFEPDSQGEIVVDYRTDVTQYSSQVSNLTQGRSYNFTVVSESGVNVQSATPKTSEEQSVEQRTVPATPYGLNIIPTQTTLSLNWSYVGDADDFNITVMPSEGTVVFNGDLMNPAGEVTGLTPGTEYDVSVVTISGGERSASFTNGTRTLPDKPSPVRNPVADPVNKNTIRLTYESPASPNGIIETYRISYIGTRDSLQDHEFTSVYGPVLTTVTFDDLYPGYSYIFTIIAVNDGGFESDPVSTDSVTTPEEVPPPVPEDYPYIENTVHSERLTTRFTVELPRDLFSHENGELMTFSVIITTQANDADVQSTERTYNDRSQGAYITIFRMPYPYPPSFESSRRRRATESNVLVVIGNETCSGSSSEYCNGPLNDNTRYYYAFRAYNSMGSTTSDTFGPVDTVKDNTTGIAVGVSMSLFAIIFVIAVGAFVTMRRRKRNTCNSQRPSLEGNENRGFIPPGDDQEMRKMKRKPGSSMYRKSHSKPVLLTNFEDHYRRMKADSDFKFTEEYDEIRQVGKGQPIVAALEMVNRAKNRFTNILPYEHSRVKLAALADEPDTDYINANYMPGYGGPREFIACQGPLPGTVDDMWRMIWEKNTSIVVMLTQLVEMGKIKCHQYWPENYNPVTYGTIEVTMQAVQQFDHWVIREFTLVKGDDIRKLTQYHFMSWPDHGVPNQTSFMLDFVRTVREAIQKVNSENPTVVHCSAGVGRTGTYIALDRLMQMMQEHDFVDIFGIICEMRMQRNLMVQTEKQYIFIHECVMDLLRREDGDTGESIYVNFNANGYNGDVSKNLLDQAV